VCVCVAVFQTHLVIVVAFLLSHYTFLIMLWLSKNCLYALSVLTVTNLCVCVCVFQEDIDSPSRKSTHTVTMKKSDAGHSVTEYGPDSRTDLFQVRVKGFYGIISSPFLWVLVLLTTCLRAVNRMPSLLWSM